LVLGRVILIAIGAIPQRVLDQLPVQYPKVYEGHRSPIVESHAYVDERQFASLIHDSSEKS
jgi:hypothetical protein